MNYKLFEYTLKQHINNRLEQSKIKITDLALEELMSFALDDSNNKHFYKSGSHKKGVDISIFDENISIKSAKPLNLSIKAGKFIKNQLSISSFRLTRYKDDLNKMIDFIDNDGKNFDKYFILSRCETKKDVKYIFYILPSDIFCASEFKWVDTINKNGKNAGWHTINNDNITLKIVKSMSSQLWIYINKNFIEKYKSFEIIKDKQSLGEKRFIATI